MAIGRFSALSHLLSVFFQLLGKGGLTSTQDLDGEKSCVDGTCLADAHARNRDSLGHLHGGE